MYDLAKMFLHCLNHWNLETPNQREKNITDAELQAYKNNFSRWLCYSHIPEFCECLTRFDTTLIFGHTFLRSVFQNVRKQLIGRFRADKDKMPDEKKSLVLTHFPLFLSLLEEELYSDKSPIWDPDFRLSPPPHVTQMSNTVSATAFEIQPASKMDSTDMDKTVENLMFRFPHLSVMIFDHLDNQSLVNSKLVSKDLNIYLSEQKFHQIRIIKETVKKFQELRQPWSDIFKTANTETIVNLGCAVDKFYSKQGLKYLNYEGITPLHVAAGVGNVALFNKILERAQNKDPIDDMGFGPMMFAVGNGHIEMTKAIMKKSEDKNPKSRDIDLTPLHTAAISGHIEIFKMIMKEAKDKAPKDTSGWTPLHSAAYYGQMNICETFINYLADKNPRSKMGTTTHHFYAEKICKEICKLINDPDNQGRTPLYYALMKNNVDVCMLMLTKLENKNPVILLNQLVYGDNNTVLHMAAEKGYLDICRLILKNVQDKNPQNSLGQTPLSLASKKGHINVCILICLHLNKNFLSSAGKIKNRIF